MKKYILGGIVVVLLGGYALWSASRSQMATQTPVDPTSTTSAPGQTSTSSTTVTTTTTTTTGSTYKDGTYTGSVGDAAPYGKVQVSVTISGGKIASIKMLQNPQGPGETNRIAQQAFPVLIQEAIAAQSAKVNIVSGATQDSQGFQQSLEVALTAAKA